MLLYKTTRRHKQKADKHPLLFLLLQYTASALEGAYRLCPGFSRPGGHTISKPITIADITIFYFAAINKHRAVGQGMPGTSATGIARRKTNRTVPHDVDQASGSIRAKKEAAAASSLPPSLDTNVPMKDLLIPKLSGA